MIKKTIFIFLLTLLGVVWGAWGIKYYKKVQHNKQIVAQKEEAERIRREQEEKALRYKQELNAYAARERQQKAKLKALSTEIAHRVTLEMMEKISPYTGKNSKHKLKRHHYDKATQILVIDIYSEWESKTHLFSDYQQLVVETRVSIFGSDEKTFIEIVRENPAFSAAKQNYELQRLASSALDFGLMMLNEYRLTFF